MSKMFSKLVLGMLALAGAALPLAAAVPGTKTLPGHVLAVTSKLTATGQLPATNRLRLAIGLPIRDQGALDILLRQIYDPASPNYKKYLTPAEFAAQFGATEQDYQSVIAFARANNLTVEATHPNRLVLDVSGSVADIEAAFQVKLQSYKHPTEARTFFAPSSEPVVSASLPILQVCGLDNYYLPQSQIRHPAPKSNSGAASSAGTSAGPNVGSGPGGSYMAADLRTAYVPGTTLTGAGQSVGLVQFDGFFPSDIATYAAANNMVNPPQVVVVPVDGGVPYPGFGNIEVAMDIEMIFAMAPGVSTVYVYEAPNPSPWVDILSRMANDNLAKQLSSSWGGGPPNPLAEQIFQQMALQGQSFYDAVGDTDAFVDQVNPPEFPAESPNITLVGGTVLTTGTGSTYSFEQVWNDRFPRYPGYQGTCGGISPDYAIPTWQQGVSMASNGGSTTQRNMPDVAMIAFNIWIAYDGGTTGPDGGGTSSAAPLWAAFTALVNQQAVSAGHATVGFVNPALYSIASGPNYLNCFHDVTAGDNTWPASPNNFFAVPGYDLCTGLGTPNGTNLISALANVNATPTIPAPLQPWGQTLSGMNGSDPNGLWLLYIQDDTPLFNGTNYNGWYVTLTTANPVGSPADNQLYISATNVSVTLGSQWTTILAVTNYGPAAASNVYVSSSLPLSPDVTLVSTNVGLGSVTNLGGALVWNLGDLAVNTGGTLALHFQGNVAGVYTNISSVASSSTDPNPDNDSVTLVASVSVSIPPVITPVFPPGGGKFLLSVTSNPGTTTVIQASTNLVTWVPVYTNVTPFVYTNSTTNFPAQFYRAVMGP
jgi:subtilase family serine protease